MKLDVKSENKHQTAYLLIQNNKLINIFSDKVMLDK